MRTFHLSVAAILLASCGTNYQKAQSGLLYKIAEKGSVPK
jgi:hypothetical protein